MRVHRNPHYSYLPSSFLYNCTEHADKPPLYLWTQKMYNRATQNFHSPSFPRISQEEKQLNLKMLSCAPEYFIHTQVLFFGALEKMQEKKLLPRFSIHFIQSTFTFCVSRRENLFWFSETARVCVDACVCAVMWPGWSWPWPWHFTKSMCIIQRHFSGWCCLGIVRRQYVALGKILPLYEKL